MRVYVVRVCHCGPKLSERELSREEGVLGEVYPDRCAPRGVHRARPSRTTSKATPLSSNTGQWPKRFPVTGPSLARLLELLREEDGKPLRERRNGQR